MSRKIHIPKEVLEELYYDKDMTIAEIAKKLEVGAATVYNRMVEYGFKFDKGEKISRKLLNMAGYDRKWSKLQREIFDGLMVSDGSIYRHRNRNYRKTYICRFQLVSKYWEFCKHVIDILPDGLFSENQPYADIRVHDKFYSDGMAMLYKIQSRADKYITEQYYRWYSDGEKEIPDDFVVTPVVLKYWFICDGTMGGRYVRLDCTPFSDLKVLEIVIPQLHEVGIHCRYKRLKYRNEAFIHIGRADDIARFYEYIGDCPVDCFAYKWGW